METAMSNKVRDASGKFAPKSEVPRQVRSVNLTDDALLLHQIQSAAVVRLCMEIFRRRCNWSMAQSLRQQMNRRSPVESVGSLAMSQPVSASLLRNSRAFRSFLNQVSNRNPVQAAAVSCFPTPKNWRANSQHFLCCSKVLDTETKEVEPRESCRPCHKSRVSHFHR